MNREFLPEAVLGVTVGLLLVVLAVYRTSAAPNGRVLVRAAMLSVLLYAIVAVQPMVVDGLTAWGLLLLLVLLCLPVLVGVWAAKTPLVAGPVAQGARVAVGVGLTSMMLIAAAQTVSLLSRLDPRMVVLVLAVVAGLLVAAEGAVASRRISSLAVWFLAVPVVLSLALGFLLGNVSVPFDAIILTDGIPWAIVVCLAVAFAVLGAADTALRACVPDAGASPLRVLVWALVVVVLLMFGLLMFLGGVVVAPTVQFFVVPANIDALPGLAGVLLAVLTVLFAALVAHGLSGVRLAGGQPRTGLFVAGAVIAVLVALIVPGIDRVVIATALVAAALVAARSERVVGLSLVAALVAFVVLAVTGTATLGIWPAVAIVVVALLGWVLSAVLGGPDPGGEKEGSDQPLSHEAEGP